MKIPAFSFLCPRFWLCLAGICLPSVVRAPNGEACRYETDFQLVKEIGMELREGLKPSFRAHLSPSPLWLKEDVRPYIRTDMLDSENHPVRMVYVTDGLIRLAASLSHARAADKIEPGFFTRHVKAVYESGVDKIAPEIPPITEPRYWTEDVLNEQVSCFNQMMGNVASIHLAHHYLGHYEKYADLLHDSGRQAVTIAEQCSFSEWEQAFKLGTANALECGYGFDGLIALYECIEQMPRRPAWARYFLHYKADIGKLKKDLALIENRFFGQTR